MKPPSDPNSVSENQRAWWKKPGVVYFIAVGVPPIAVKIGVAARTGDGRLLPSLKKRLSQIQSSNHEPVRLIGVVAFESPDHEYPSHQADALERMLHNDFQHLARFKRDTRGSEWFTAAPDLLARIKSIATPPHEIGLPELFCSPIKVNGQIGAI